MQSFNTFERKWAKYLSNFPRIKKHVKRIYQYFSYLIANSTDRCITKYVVKDFGTIGFESFFGYYDKCPIDLQNNLLLWHETDLDTRKPPDPTHPVKIIIADIQGRIIKNYFSKAYNWQQGSRLHWYKKNVFCFNDYINGKYVSRFINIKNNNNIEQIVDSPVMDTNSKNGFGISINFSRLYCLQPEYGYSNKELKHFQNAPANDGLYIIDINNNEKELIVNYKQLLTSDISQFYHLINHPMISPTGEYCVFFHRYYRNIGGQRFDRIMLLNLKNNSLEELIPWGMASHLIWYDDETIFGYFMVGGKNSFYFINIHNKKITKLNIADHTFEDGHPSVFKDSASIVFDTYPDKSRLQHLFHYRQNVNKLDLLGSFYHGLEYNTISRCDLHPRFGVKETQIFFDTVFEGKRRFMFIDLGIKS